MVGGGLGNIGQRFPVLNGGGYSTLRGLAVPSKGDVMVRALGYYAPGDGGGGMFFWNPKREFAMPRQVTVINGGTDYRPVFAAVEAVGLRPSCLIYCTDLECDRYPDEPPYPVLWIAPESARNRPPFGEVLELSAA